jgi:hypothetical protein
MFEKSCVGATLRKRRCYLVGGTVLSALCADLTLCYAPDFHLAEKKNPDLVAYAIMAFWLMVPPVYLWLDWVIFAGDLDADNRERAKHTHDLARNIWVGLLAILAYAFKLGAPG